MSEESLILWSRTVEQFLLPPGAPLMLSLIGLILAWRRVRSGLAVLGCGLALAYISALPITAAGLAHLLEVYPPLTTAGLCGRGDVAIVVLGGPDRYARAPEYGGDTLGPLALERVRYAAHLARRCALPILVVGGRLPGEEATGAAIMEQVLSEQGLPVTWADGRSRSTRDNARFAGEVLVPRGFSTLVLVTHAWHMRRAVVDFAGLGLRVEPAPTGFQRPSLAESGWRGLVPSAAAQMRVRWMLRELAGLALSAVRPPIQLDGSAPVKAAVPARAPGSADQ